MNGQWARSGAIFEAPVRGALRKCHLRLGVACLTLTFLATAIFIGSASGDEATDHSAVQPSATGPHDAESLMAFLESAGAVRANFESVQIVSMLMSPLESAGELYFEPPDKMVRVTNRPGQSKVVVQGTHVAIRDETGVRTLDLGASRAGQGLVEHLMIVLRGDLPELRDRYRIEFDREDEVWQLTLVPRHHVVRALIDEIVVAGIGWQLGSITSRESNGDSTHSAFSAIEIGVELTETDRADLFATEAPTPQADRRESARPLANSALP